MFEICKKTIVLKTLKSTLSEEVAPRRDGPIVPFRNGTGNDNSFIGNPVNDDKGVGGFTPLRFNPASAVADQVWVEPGSLSDLRLEIPG